MNDAVLNVNYSLALALEVRSNMEYVEVLDGKETCGG
jgi:hypothetical protein